MTCQRMFLVGVGLMVFLATVTLEAGPVDATRHLHSKHIEVVHEAEHSVDQAWDIYHRAALGGTIASPVLQAQIEQHLHEARNLISQAQQAANGKDGCGVRRLVRQIKIHATQAMEGSKEQKK